MGFFNNLWRSASKPDYMRLAQSLDERLTRIVGADGRGAPGPEAMLRLLAELDADCAAFFREKGIDGLCSAVAHWAKELARAEVVSAVGSRFADNDWLGLASVRLHEKGPRGALGLVNFQLALHHVGVLEGQTIIAWVDEGAADSPDPMEGIVETLWPFSKNEESLRERIARVSNWEVPSVAWELFALRLDLLRLVLYSDLHDSPAFWTLLERVNDEARRRLRDVRWPANYSVWIDNRHRGYEASKSNHGGPPDDRIAAARGAQFAAGFDSDDAELVTIGVEQAKRALNRLVDLVEDIGGAAWGQTRMVEFLAEVLPRLAPGRGRPALQRDEERHWRRQLDRRLLEFGATHSLEELRLAVRRWAGKLATVDEIAAVILRFGDTDWVDSQVQMLKVGDPTAGAGFAYFPDALTAAGVLPPE